MSGSASFQRGRRSLVGPRLRGVPGDGVCQALTFLGAPAEALASPPSVTTPGTLSDIQPICFSLANRRKFASFRSLTCAHKRGIR